MTRLPARVDPVNDTMSTSGCEAMASPTTGPDTGHEVEHAGREADVVEDLGQDEGVERRHLARLQHHGATRGQGRGHLGRDLVQRVVPRGDGTHHADGLADDERVADLFLEGELGGELGGGGEAHHGQPHLDEVRQREGHADFLGDQRGDLRGARRQRLLDTLEGLGPLVSRRRRPLREGVGGAARRRGPRPRGCPAGMVPMTSSVAELTTSITPLPVEGTQAPPM